MQMSDFVTNRIKAILKEVSVVCMIELCQMPITHNERGLTKLLQHIVVDTNVPLNEWTAQERYACLLYYMIAVDGDSDISDGLNVSDYLLDVPNDGLDYEFEMSDGEESVALRVQPLTAEYLEAIENIVMAGGVNGVTNQAAFELCAMAAQIVERGKADDGLIQELVHTRAKALLEQPVSVYEYLREQWLIASVEMAHLVNLAFDDGGVVLVSSKQVEIEKGVFGFMPARFCYYAVYDESTAEVWRSVAE